MMFASHNFLEDLGLVLCVAAVTTVIFQALKQPVVVGYLIAGLIVGPHVPIPLFADSARIHTLSELGVILLMFALGLEFDLRKLIRLGPTSGFITALQVGLMLWLGYMCGRALGWTTLESIFTGAFVSISSTTIVAKAFEDERVDRSLRELAMGVLLAEDLTAVVELAVLTALASGASVSVSMIAVTVGRLALFLVALVGVGILIVPRAIRLVVRLDRPETILIASVGICFAFAIVAEMAGYSVALGAFLAGMLVAESGESRRIEHLVAPVRDIFAAVFFVSVGMMIEPALIVKYWPALVLLTFAVVFGKVAGVSIAAMLSGTGVKTSVQAGMSLAQIGEFSFIIAGVGLQMGATRNFIYTLAVSVSAVTTFLTPFLIRASGPVGEFVAGRLPEPLGAFTALYGGWMERMRGGSAPPGEPRSLRFPIIEIGASAAAIIAILIANEIDPLDFTTRIAVLSGYSYFDAGLIADLFALVACVPFVAGLFYGSRNLARALAARAIPAEARGEGSAAAAMAEMLQLTILVVLVMPMLAIVQPFLGPVEGVGALAIGVLLMLIQVWRSVRRMRGQMRAAAGLIASAIAGVGASVAAEHEVEGLGTITPVKLNAGTIAVGSTLREINLRSRTGATAIAIARANDGLIVPTGGEALREGDVLELAGPRDAIEAAARILARPREAAAPAG
ncbi:MAG TPA: cation:proton antiporter [Candidatus Binataceae bacterium]